MYTADMSHREAREWAEHFAAEVRRSDMPQSYRQRARQDLQDCRRRKSELVAQVQDWYADGPSTHGEERLACVTNEGPFENMAGVGPDHHFQGNAVQACHWLHDLGYTEIDTEVGELRAMWDAIYNIDEAAEQAAWNAMDWQSGLERSKLIQAQLEDER
jgi:hypothetical protein